MKSLILLTQLISILSLSISTLSNVNSLEDLVYTEQTPFTSETRNSLKDVTSSIEISTNENLSSFNNIIKSQKESTFSLKKNRLHLKEDKVSSYDGKVVKKQLKLSTNNIIEIPSRFNHNLFLHQTNNLFETSSHRNQRYFKPLINKCKWVDGHPCPKSNYICWNRVLDKEFSVEKPEGNVCWVCLGDQCICEGTKENGKCEKWLQDIRKCEKC
ncbi:hypothetical protein K502DRAFT_349252 [Neoconidiobolus thromboides FSU 785]|nr:hypothetical protein K502DRAFT_349252 [Neoconidiobolus thromboides FSU 785]